MSFPSHAHSDSEIAEALAADLALVEDRLHEAIASREPRLEEISRYLVDGGGKRIRPLVALGVYRACGGLDPEPIVDVAVALELIHSATLLHDDIIDGADLRRGREAPCRRFGVPDTLVTGDFLFSQAFRLCGRFDQRVVRWAAEACVGLTEGEVLQARHRGNPDVALDDYWEIIRRKTAGVFEQGARIAAYLAQAEASVVDAAGRTGAAIGMAFQVIDDLLDVAGDPDRTGKPVGTDLYDRNPSLPIVMALPLSDRVRRVWSARERSDEAVSEALESIRDSGVLDEVRRYALEFSAEAEGALERLPPSAARDILAERIEELATRAG